MQLHFPNNLAELSSFTPDVINTIIDQQLFKCFMPQSLGGLNMSLKETLDVIEKVAYINGSLGWLVQIGNGGNYFAGSLNDEVVKKFFGGPAAVLAGSGAITGIAKPTEGGYNCSGSWKYCSGSEYASFFTFNCAIEGTNEFTSIAVPRNAVKVIPDWNSFGLPFTSTNTVSLQETFVPVAHCFQVGQRKSTLQNPIFNFPFVHYAQSFFMFNLYGMFQKYLDEGKKFVDASAPFWKEKFPKRVADFEQLHTLGIHTLQASRSNLLEHISHIEKKPADAPAMTAAVLKDKNSIVQITHDLYPLLGMQASYKANPMGQCYQDLNCLGQHIVLNPYFYYVLGAGNF